MSKTRKPVLGKGLSALLQDPNKDSSISAVNSPMMAFIHPDEVAVNPYQPRTSFDEEALADLAQSISELGIIQPITVRKINDGSYQLVSGERRLRASKLAKLDSIPAFVREANDQESLEMALVENIQREDLDPIEIALSYQRLIDEIDLTQESMSKRVGKKRSTITNYLRLLKLHPKVQGALRRREIMMGHGRALMAIEDEKAQTELLASVLEKSLSVRATEELVRKYGSPKITKLDPKDPSKKVLSAIDDLEQGLNRKVQLKANQDGSGSITVTYNSTKDLIQLKKQLLGE
ncbi:MAG: chromosome partitioning protein ParB [Bacteroidetes bacterium]|jgi:ParB family chromosome partitioning protein|nr:MAG: chromosome partitioning protein ParB [Bacteroidota bacterium]